MNPKALFFKALAGAIKHGPDAQENKPLNLSARRPDYREKPVILAKGRVYLAR